jgi:hypothetical protein
LALKKGIQLEALSNILQNYHRILEVKSLDKGLAEFEDERFYSLTNQFIIRLLIKMIWDDENDVFPLLAISVEATM